MQIIRPLLFAAAALATAVTAAAGESSSFTVQTPVYSYTSNTTYSTSQQHYDQAYQERRQDLMAGRNFYNDRDGPYTSTTSTHTVGLSGGGVGASYSTTSSPTNRSAAEEALHMYERTQPVRDLQRQIHGSGSGAAR